MFTLAQLQTLARSVGFPETEIAKIAAIGIYESGGNENVVNDGSKTGTVEYSVGLWQINTRVHKNYTVAQLKNPQINAQEAYRIYKTQGYNAWYNSLRKYNNNYQGVAAQSRAIYANGGGTPQAVVDLVKNPSPVSNKFDYTTFGIIVAAGLGAMILINK